MYSWTVPQAKAFLSAQKLSYNEQGPPRICIIPRQPPCESTALPAPYYMVLLLVSSNESPLTPLSPCSHRVSCQTVVDVLRESHPFVVRVRVVCHTAGVLSKAPHRPPPPPPHRTATAPPHDRHHRRNEHPTTRRTATSEVSYSMRGRMQSETRNPARDGTIVVKQWER